jgi:small-conductance mechanosensitive channel
MNPSVAEIPTGLQRVLDLPLLRLKGEPLTVQEVLVLLILFGLVLVLERLFRRMFMGLLLRRTRFEPSLQYAIGRITGYLFIALGFYVALTVSDIDLSSLTILAGAVGVGLGFGLQNILSNFISGLILLAERPIALGHRIEVGSVVGQVTQIKLRSTTVVTNDNITVIVPNSNFITNAVTNWSYGDPKVRLRLAVGVAYGTDVQRLRRVLLEVAAENPAVLKQPAPSVRFLGFGESSLDFELAVWTIEMAQRPTCFRSDRYFTIEQKLREHQIEIPFPQRDLHLRSGALVVQPPGEPPRYPASPEAGGANSETTASA